MATLNFDNDQITFSDAGLTGETSNNPTALMFSKSGEPVLFVAQLDGTIKRYVVEKQLDGTFAVSKSQTPSQTGAASQNITVIKDTVENYDDKGNVATGNQTDQRQITGLVTTVEEIDGVEYDVVYVASSDRRHGGGGSATDKGVDPNSGQINKLIIDKFSGQVIDSYAVIRGLPRSSENHSTNGIDLAVDANGDVIMFVAQGGNTNKGAPSNNFVGFIDAPLSGTILKINLTELEQYDVRTDAAGEKFILDLPTLNDPGREDVDLSTLNIQNLEADPLFSMDVAPGNAPEWAGSSDAGSGTNSAKMTSHVLVSENGQLKLVENPMSVFQPGYRNQYDVHVTENGEVVSWDNGPNGGWGGQPIPLVDQGGNQNYVEDWTKELATNDFNESGSSTFGDWLHVGGKVDDPFGPYAGDANPIRAAKEVLALAFDPTEPLYVDDGSGTLIINPDVYLGETPTTPIYDYDGTTVIFTGQDQALDFLSRLLPHYDEQPDGSWVDVRPEGPGGYKLMPVDLHTVVIGYDWKSPGSSIADPTKHFDGTDIAGDTAFSPEAQLLDPSVDGGLVQGGTSSNGLSEYTASSWFGGALKGTIISTAFGNGGKLQFVELQDTNDDGRTDAAKEIGTISSFGSQPLSVQALGDNGLGPNLIDNDGDGIDDFSGVIFAATYGANNITTFVPDGTPTDPTVDADSDGVNDTQDTHAWGADNGKGVLIGSFFGPLEARWHMELSSDAVPFGVNTNVGPAPDAGIVAAWKNGVDAARDGFLFDGDNFDIGGASSFLSVGTAPVGTAEGAANSQKDALAVGAILSPSLASATITAEMLNIFDYQINAEANKTWDGGEKVGIFVGPDQSTFMHAAVVVQADGTAVLELYAETNDANAVVQTVALTGIESPLQVENQDSVAQIGFVLDLEANTAIARARYQNPNLDGDPATADADWSQWFETGSVAIPQAVLDSLYGNHVNFGNEVGATIGMFANAPAGDDSFAASWDYVEVVGTPKEQADGGTVLYRINAGGAEVAATDGGPAWSEDQSAATGAPLSVANGQANAGTPSAYLDTDLTDQAFGANFSGANDTIAPDAVFATERYGQISGSAQGSVALAYDFPVVSGQYLVNLYFAEVWGGANTPGKRVFDVVIEDTLAFDDVDLTDDYGFNTVGVASYEVTVTDGNLDLDFLKGSANNPKVSAIEIVALDGGNAEPGPAVSVLGAILAEDAGTTGITIETDAPVPADETVVVTWEVRAIANGATPEVDFTVPGGSFVSHTGEGVYQGTSEIAGGSSDVTIPVTILDDTAVEADELFEVVITAVSGANATIGTASASVTIEDNDEPPVPNTSGTVLYRVNVGGPQVAATDDGPAWSADQGNFGTANNSPYLVSNSNGTSTYNGNAGSAHPGAIDVTDASIPDGTPAAIFNTERYDAAAAPAQQWQFPVADQGLAPGDQVEVRLYFAELFGQVDQPGERVFDVEVEGAVPTAFDDIDPIAVAGPKGGFMRSAVVTIDADGTLDLTLVHGIENPALKGIEILSVGEPAPVDVSLDIADAGAVQENGDVDPTALDFALTASDDFTGDMDVTFDLSINGATATGETATVSFVNGAGTLSVAIASDDVDDGDDAVSVTLTGAADAAGTDPRTVVLGTTTASGTITEDDVVTLDPNDIDGDGIANVADPFAYDGQNGLGNVVAAGSVFRQDFDTDGDVFAAGGFTGILVNPAFVPADTSETDPYGDRTTEATSFVEGGLLKVTSSNTDLFDTGVKSNQSNQIKDNYIVGADVSGVDTFTIEAKIQGGWLGTAPGSFASFGITLGAGGTDDYVKLVLGGQGNIVRFQLGQEDSLIGVKEENVTVPSGLLAAIASAVFRIEVDKSGAEPTLVGSVVLLDASNVEIETLETSTRTITGSLLQALDGENPLTGAGGIAYGISITDWGNVPAFEGQWDYLELKGPEVQNAAPAVNLTPAALSLPEDTDTTAGTVKVADIVVADDGIGTNALSLSGADAASFVIVDGASGPELHLAQGVALDFETKTAFDVTVAVDDATVGATPDATAPFTLAIDDVLETPADSALGIEVGDFSEAFDAPTEVTLAAGDNAILATQAGDGDGRDYDFITVVVPEGHALTGITLDSFEDYDDTVDNGTFIGLAAGDTFPFAFGTADENSTALLGGHVVFETEVGQDLFGEFADGTVSGGGNAPTQGFTTLGAGTYTFGFSQNQATATTGLTLTVEPVVTGTPGAYLPNADGNFVFEAEAAENPGPGGYDFKDASDLPAGHAAPTGTGYVLGTSNHFGSPNGETLSYSFTPDTDGFVRVNLVSSREGVRTPAPGHAASTIENDSWTAIQKDGQFLTAEPFNGSLQQINGFYKTYSTSGAANSWIVANKNVDNVGKPIVFAVEAGETYDFLMSVRSAGHEVDRIVLQFSETGFNGGAAGNNAANGFQNMELSPQVPNVVVPGDDVGEAVLGITLNSNNVQTSNFGNNSFQVTNTGTKLISKIEIDVTNALYPDAVFDPFGVAGDSTAKQLTINSAGGTGVQPLDHGTNEAPGSTYIGEGGTKGFEGIQILFNDFDPSETVGFSVDMDPNSIAGTDKGPLDSGAQPQWDVGGISGAELIGSTFTVTFADGTTATGQLQGNNNQAGAQALASQAIDTPKDVTLTVNGLGEGNVGLYNTAPTVIVNGPAGETARIVLTKGIIQPENNNLTGSDAADLQAQLDALAASAFPANNAAEFQTVDIVLTGQDQDITSLFDFTQVQGSGFAMDEDKFPLGFVASVIDPDNNDLAVGPVTAPIYLTYAQSLLPVVTLTAPAPVLEGGDSGVTEVVFTAAVNDPTFTGSVDVTYDETVDGATTRKTATLDFGGTEAPTLTVSVANDNAGDGDDTVSLALVSTTSTDAIVSTAAVATTVTEDDGGPVEGDVLLRINAFGPELTATDGGPNWVADAPFYSAVDNRGDTLLTATAGDTGAPDELFQLTRSANSAMNFTIDAVEHLNGNGTYKVKLYFTEPFFAAANARVFDTAIEGVVYDNLDNLDPAATISKGVGFVVENVVEVNDGVLNIEVLTGALSGAGGKQNPVISGIEVIEMVTETDANVISVVPADVTETGDDGNSPVTFTLVASEAGFTGTVELTYETTVGGVTTTTTDTFDFAAGTPTITVDVANDDVDDGAEAVTVKLLSTTTAGVSVDDTAQTASVLEDDFDPTEVEGGSATIGITENGGLAASTFSGSSFTIANTSVAGVTIEKVIFDLSTGILPDMVFDPFGTGGDAVAKALQINSGGADTGFVAPANNTAPFSQPRNGGWDVMELNFTDFDPGETIAFSVDVDPNSIQNGSGSGQAGAVSGAELIGSTITVVFTDGTSTETTLGSLFENGTLGGGISLNTSGDAPAAPTLALDGFNPDEVATLPGQQTTVADLTQTVVVSGAVGATVHLVQLDGRLLENASVQAFDVTDEERPFYANELMAGKEVFTGIIGPDGTASFEVTLLESAGTPAGGINHFMAVLEDPVTGVRSTASTPLVLKQGTPVTPTQTITVNASGEAAAGVAPIFELIVDGVVVATQEVTATETTAYDITYAAEAPATDVVIRFINDAFIGAGGPGNDSNLFIDSIVVDGETFEAETRATVTSDDQATAQRFDLDGQREDMRLNGVMEFDLSPVSVNERTITVTARGEAAQGLNPVFQLIVDGEVVAQQEVTAATYTDYALTYDAETAPQDVAIRFVNEAWFAPGGPGNDMNLFIDKIEVEGVTYVAEDSATVTSDNGALAQQFGLDGPREDMRINGIMDFDLTPAATQTFTVFAGGEAAQGNDPSFKVFESGVLVGEATVTNAADDASFAGSYVAYEFEVSAGATLQDLEIVYDGDFWVSPGGIGNDTNLFIDKVVLGGEETEEDGWSFLTDNRSLSFLDGSREDLRANGTLTFDAPTTQTFTVYAGGEAAQGNLPSFKVFDDGTLIGQATVTNAVADAAFNGNFAAYTFQVAADTTIEDLEIVYDSDFWVSPGGIGNDSNLFLDRVELDGTTYEENAWTFTVNDRSLAFLDGSREDLRANGLVDFDLLG